MLYKYPRTYHFPWSKGISDDDKIHQTLDAFQNLEIVVTIKMDGENTSLYNNYFHARSLDSNNHPSRNWVKNFWAKIRHNIPPNYRICGENLFAKHSIYYADLMSYFYGFSVWNNNICLKWDDTLEWFQLLSITPVQTIYRGKFDENLLISISENLDPSKIEGYVVRNTESFLYEDFSNNVGKFVRENHVNKNSKHWQTAKICKNMCLIC